MSVTTDTIGGQSRLLLARADPRDSGNYSCVPGPGATPASVTVHVLNGIHFPSLDHFVFPLSLFANLVFTFPVQFWQKRSPRFLGRNYITQSFCCKYKKDDPFVERDRLLDLKIDPPVSG